MPLSIAQIETLSKVVIDNFRKNDVVDQINVERPLFDALIKKPKNLTGGKEFLVSQLFISNSDNTQSYSGNGRVTYNQRNPDEQVKFRWENLHAGFSVSEDEMFRAGVVINHDAGKDLKTREEAHVLTDYMKNKLMALEMGHQEAIHARMWLDGTQGADNIVGIDGLVSLTPSLGTVGALSAVTNTYWRNAARTALAPTLTALTDAMEKSKRDIIRTNGRISNIFAGSDFIDALRNAVLAANVTQITYTGGSRISIDMATQQMRFDGIPIVWVPEFDSSFGTAPAIPFAKRCYMLDMRYISFGRAADDFQKMRYPGRPIDQYAFYYAMTSKIAMETTGRNKQAVLAIA
jgi:hypothetical protein